MKIFLNILEVLLHKLMQLEVNRLKINFLKGL